MAPVASTSTSMSVAIDSTQSIFAAAIGLTNLSSVSPPTKSSPRAGETVFTEIHSQAQDTGNDFIKSLPTVAQNPTIENQGAITMARRSVLSTKTRFYPNDQRPCTEASMKSRPPIATMPSPWPSPTPPPLGSGFQSRHVLSLKRPHPAIARLPVTAINRSSVTERAAAVASVHPPYTPCYPERPSHASCLPILHTQHRTMPLSGEKNFPETLSDIVSSQEHSHIVSWLPHGKGFLIHDKQLFANDILPMYFHGTKFTSFTRRLKRWNFVRVQRGPELGAYYNENFVRDNLTQLNKMRYRAEGKKKYHISNGKEDVNKNKCGDQIKEEVEMQVQESPPKKEDQASGSPSLKSRVHNKYEKYLPKNETRGVNTSPSQLIHEQHLLSDEVSSRKTEPKSANPQVRPIHLASTLPKRLASESIENHPTKAPKTSLLPSVNPARLPTGNPGIQREMLVAPPIQRQAAVAHGARPVPTRRRAPHPMIRGMRQPYHATAFNRTSRMPQDERERGILKAKRIPATIHDPNNQEVRASKVRTSYKQNNVAMNAIVYDSKPSLMPPLVPPLSGRSPTALRNNNKVYMMMSAQEEADFARYLFLKRNNQRAYYAAQET